LDLFAIIKDEDQRNDAVSCLISTFRKGFSINPLIKFEVLIHKVDGFSDERKMEIHHEIQQQISELLLQDGNESIIQKMFLK
jgi:Ras-related GTP-binding protein C/D